MFQTMNAVKTGFEAWSVIIGESLVGLNTISIRARMGWEAQTTKLNLLLKHKQNNFFKKKAQLSTFPSFA